MTQNLSKSEKIVILGLIVCVLGVASFSKSVHFSFSKSQKSSGFEPINYKMGQAEDSYEGYSLNGRDVQREFESEEMKKAQAAKVEKAKVAEQKKKEEQKTKAAEVAKKNAQAAAENAKKNAQALAAAQADRDASVKHDTAKANDKVNDQGNYANNYMPNNQTATGDDKKETKKSYAEIRSEFYSNPTQATMLKIVNYYKKGDVTSQDFYKLMTDVLSSGNQTYIGLALYGLRATPSLESFTLNSQYYSSANTTYQTYIETSLVAYNNSQNFSVLSQALKSTSKVVVLKAIEVIKYGISSAQSTQTASTSDNRGSRTVGSSSTYSLTQYLSLQTSLTYALSNQTDSEVVSGLNSIQTLITEIKSTQVASN